MNKNKSKKMGFTLIEMLVAVFVFMIVFLIAASFVNLASGQTKSSRTRNLTTNLRHTMDVINQKMATANGKKSDIYGFKVQTGDQVLGIVSFDTTTDTNKCTFIGQKDNGIYMKVNNCNGWQPINSLDQPLTDPSANVTDLVFSGTTNWDPASGDIPYLKMTITAEDADPKYAADNKIELQTSYTLDYLTIQRLKSL